MSWCTSRILIFEPLVLKFGDKVVVCLKYARKRFSDAISILLQILALFGLHVKFCKYLDLWLQNLKSEFHSF